MSLIIPERKLIFLHIPKCAGQSVEKALGFKHQHRHHKRNDLPENWFEYLRFTFVRHPLSRFLSACNYNLRVALNTRHELQKLPYDQLSPTKRYRLHLAETRPPLTAMVDDLHRGRLRKMITFKPQSLWLLAGQPQFIGRVEAFDHDFQFLLRLAGLSIKGFAGTAPPHINRSTQRLTAEQLSSADRKRIQRYYRLDYKLTGYGKSPPPD
ncbi:sulfotransferase family protein [Synechococcus sp. MIT S1220]|uniref:sulfotransferase family protein n=1 Tax=Synechococcus sp. MIT S1220 TaxID=3082549 RepID=UPI0039B10E54